MKIGTCEDLNCKFIQFHISSKESIPKTSPCDPHKPNAFAVMLAAQNEHQLPQSQLVRSCGPQRFLSDIITWISNFDTGWTKDVIETGSVVCKRFSNALQFIDHCHQKMENNGCPIPQALNRFHGYSDYKKSHHVPSTITSEKLNEHCMELTKCSCDSIFASIHSQYDYSGREMQNFILYYKTKALLRISLPRR